MMARELPSKERSAIEQFSLLGWASGYQGGYLEGGNVFELVAVDERANHLHGRLVGQRGVALAR